MKNEDGTSFNELTLIPGLIPRILGYLPAHDRALTSLPQIHTDFKSSFQDPYLWRMLLEKHFPQYPIPGYIHEQLAYRSFYQIISVKTKIAMLFDTASHQPDSGSVEETLRILFEEEAPSFLLQINGIQRELRPLELWGNRHEMNEAEFYMAEAFFPMILTTFHTLIRILARTEVRQQDKTFLMLAAQKGYTPLVQALLNAGADLYAQTRNGMRAVQYAALGNHQDTADCINERARSPLLSPRDILQERTRPEQLKREKLTASTTAGLFIRHITPSPSPASSPMSTTKSTNLTPAPSSSSSSSSASIT